MKHLRLIGICAVLLSQLMSCGDEDEGKFTLVDERDGKTYDVISAGGNLWMAEDLNLHDATAFSYQQSLGICPDGWSLPTRDDWEKLCLAYGGYVYNGQDIGNPTRAYDRMRSEFNAPETGFYWTSTPAWQDVPTIRSSIFSFTGDVVEYGANLISFKLPCRCIKREEVQTLDRVEFSVDGAPPVRYDFYSFQHPEDATDLFFIIHKRLEENVLVDRITIFADLPEMMIGEGDPPVAATQASIHNYFNDTAPFESDQWIISTGGDLDFHFTFYDGLKVQGTFSGTADIGISVEDGFFELYLK